ncbi:MAG: hypothetical protein Q7W56_05875 [Candidatus Latescibacteria bacterium]|nr:hypothetical protein [Candidatus Latescibacterota bacterium]
MHIRPALLLALLALPVTAGASEPAVRREALLAEIELAQSKQLYLVIDPAAGEVQLMIQNVVVRRFPAVMRVGLPSGQAEIWPAAVFKLHSGLPEFERPVIRPPEKPVVDTRTTGPAAPAQPDTGASVKRTPDDLLDERNRALAGVPTVYVLHFDPGLDILVRGEAEASGFSGLLKKSWKSLGEGVGRGFARLTGKSRTLHIVMKMDPEDARRLGLTLTPQMPLLIRSE